MFKSPQRFLGALASLGTLVGASLVAGVSPAQAEDTKVSIGISGWTGFAPLTLAKEAGIYKANGLDVTIRKIPQKDRHLAIASTQLFKMDQGMGSDGIVARPAIAKVADLKGKTVGVSAPGTSPHFTLAWVLKKNGLALSDVKMVTLEPAAAASAFVAGTADLDGAVTYEPYLSLVRDKPESGKLIADSLQYPMVFDSFGCTPKFIKENPKAVKGLVDSYFQALELIEKDKMKAFTIMGADVKQTAEQFEKSQAKIKWADREANKKFFGGEIQAFNKEAAALLLEIGVIKTAPTDMDSLYDTSFLK
jgi:NitT/TauT family transport system substrate-binding protein